MRLLSKNARTYNQEGSQVFLDANALEAVFAAHTGACKRAAPTAGANGDEAKRRRQ
jgi:hypothetical protein